MPIAEASVTNPALKECDVPLGKLQDLQALLIALLYELLLNLKIFPENKFVEVERNFAIRIGIES